MVHRLELRAAIEQRFRSTDEQCSIGWHQLQHPAEQIDLNLLLEVDGYVSAKNDVEQVWESKWIHQIQMLETNHPVDGVLCFVATTGWREIFANVLRWQSAIDF